MSSTDTFYEYQWTEVVDGFREAKMLDVVVAGGLSWEAVCERFRQIEADVLAKSAGQVEGGCFMEVSDHGPIDGRGYTADIGWSEKTGRYECHEFG